MTHSLADIEKFWACVVAVAMIERLDAGDWPGA